MPLTLTQHPCGLLVEGVTDFSLPQILDCGQCFTFSPIPASDCMDGILETWKGFASNHPLTISQLENGTLLFHNTTPEVFSGNIILTWTPTTPTLNSFFLRMLFCAMLSTTLRESVSFVRTAGKLCAALSSVRTTTSNVSKELSSGCVRALEAQSVMDCFPFLLRRHLPPLW